MRKLSLGIPLLLILLFLRTTDSPHGKDFKLSCNDCHNSQGWSFDAAKATFKHDKTSFPLSGQHKILSCKSCHTDLVFTGAKTNCVSCHTDMHEQTVGEDCARCHTTQSWLVSNISGLHRTSRFPLVGAHAMADCQQCHKGQSLLRFDPMGVNCIDCHQTNFNNTANPPHLAAGFSTDCFQCHRVNSFEWGAGGFSHAFFPLTLGHNINECFKCHTPGNFANTPTNCYDCHKTNYNATTNPNHLTAGFSTNCAECHTTNPGWTPATFDHTKFPLTLGHNINECAKCHPGGNYANTSPVCNSCHMTDYGATTNPNHAAANFSTDCNTCHTTNPGWSPATLDHSFFPLTMGHNINECAKCHTNGNYTNLSPVCKDCHTVDYNATTNPNHVASNFPTDCKVCHSTAPGWTPATIDHSFFPLTQGHNINDCAQCHVNGNYTNTPTACNACHMPDYNSASNPNHLGLNFPTNCTLCHTTAPGWSPANFTHSGFPIYSGKHKQGVWTSCNDCHTNPANYTVFTCLNCHEHNQSDMDNQHDGEANYQYNSYACYLCHPNGNAK